MLKKVVSFPTIGKRAASSIPAADSAHFGFRDELKAVAPKPFLNSFKLFGLPSRSFGCRW